MPEKPNAAVRSCVQPQLEAVLQLEVAGADMSSTSRLESERHVGCEREALTGLHERIPRSSWQSQRFAVDMARVVKQPSQSLTRLVDQPKTKQPSPKTRRNVQGPAWSRPNGRGAKRCEQQLGSHARATLSAQKWLGERRHVGETLQGWPSERANQEIHSADRPIQRTSERADRERRFGPNPGRSSG